MTWRQVLDFVFPVQCGGCETAGSGLCDRCLPIGEPLLRKLPSLDVYALGNYDGRLRRAVLALKNGRRDVAEAFGARIARLIEPKPIVVPVPTTRARRRERGFDGCELIAHVACLNRARLCYGLAQVRGDSQRGRTRDARLTLRTRFAWRARPLHGEIVTLLDDVVTTGATLEECAQVIRAAGGIVEKGFVVATA